MKLNDELKKKIIADYIECENYSAVARKYNISRQTVANVVNGDKEFSEKLHQKKEENKKNVIEYMGDKGCEVCSLIDVYLAELASEDKIKRASLIQIATALGIVIDKFTVEKSQKSAEDIIADKLNEVFGGRGCADKKAKRSN